SYVLLGIYDYVCGRGCDGAPCDQHLMHRPLETLLATFGISIALQQLAKHFRRKPVPSHRPHGLMVLG
ncbi:MAG: hypothetical protein U5K75_09095, partial [Ahrensia sp.]|nr:hypothetical protein [Ahrensia sp.]